MKKLNKLLVKVFKSGEDKIYTEPGWNKSKNFSKKEIKRLSDFAKKLDKTNSVLIGFGYGTLVPYKSNYNGGISLAGLQIKENRLLTVD